MKGFKFSDCVGKIEFFEGNVLLDLWEEWCKDKDEGRTWLIQSGDAVIFNDDLFHSHFPVTFETIERFCVWLNEELVEKKWKDRKIEVLGKVVFCDRQDHDIIVVVLWQNDKFMIKTHDFL